MNTLSLLLLFTEVPIAVCSDIGPLLLAKSGVGVSGILKPPELCLKANTAGVVQLHGYVRVP